MSETFELHATATGAPKVLSVDEKAGLADLVSHLIPATDGRPSGAVVLLDRGRLYDALAVRPDLWAPLGAVLSYLQNSVSGEPIETLVGHLFSAIPEELDDFGKLIAGAYLMDSEVKQDIGYPGQEARELTNDTDEYLDILEAVVNRGETFRATPPKQV